MEQKQPLAGCRVMVVEDEFLFADRLLQVLEQAGASVIGPISNVPDALRQVARDGFEIAVVDLNLGSELAYPVAEALQQHNVPFLFATGYDQSVIPREFAGVICWEKPLDEAQLVADLARLHQAH